MRRSSRKRTFLARRPIWYCAEKSTRIRGAHGIRLRGRRRPGGERSMRQIESGYSEGAERGDAAGRDRLPEPQSPAPPFPSGPRRVSNGRSLDGSALSREFYYRYITDIRQTVRHVLGSRPRAEREDVCQTVLEKVVRALRSGRLDEREDLR